MELEGLLAKAEADLSSAVTTYAAQVAMEIDSRKELSQQELAALRDRLESEAKAERSSLEGRISDLSTKLAQANGEKASISSEFEAFRTS